MKSLQKNRAILLGAAIADAAARPLHWIYDAQKLNKLTAGTTGPEFWPNSESPFYNLPTGANSAYFDLTLVMLRSLQKNCGLFEPKIFMEHVLSHFGPNTAYEQAFQKRKLNYSPEVREKGWPAPINGPWRHGLVSTMLENYHHTGEIPVGPDNADEIDGFCAALPVWLYSKPENRIASSRTALKMVAGGDLCESHALAFFQLLDLALSGEQYPIHQLVRNPTRYGLSKQITEEIEQVISASEIAHEEFVEKVGKACRYSGTFQGALHAVLQASSYEEGVRLAILAGGCNCSRAVQVGCLLGAIHGAEKIPTKWIEATHSAAEIQSITGKLSNRLASQAA